MRIKKTLALILALVFVLTLAACSKKKDENPNLIEIDDYQALYTGAYITKDYDGDDAIVIPFTFTNNSDETQSFMWAMFYTAMQGGTELEVSTIFVSADSYDTLSDDTFTDVAPGASQDLALTYKLNNLTDQVVIEFSNLLESSTDELTIDVANLQVKTAPDTATDGDSSDTDSSDADDQQTTTDGPVTYKLTSFNVGGQVLDASVVDAMGGGYVVFNGDGSGMFSLFGDTFPITYDGEIIYTGSDQMPYTLTEKGIDFTMSDGTVYVMEITDETPDLTVTDNTGDDDDDTAVQANGYAFDADIAAEYAGDWHGMAVFYDCTGDYSDNDDVTCEIIARLVFDEDGYCTPYIRLCLSEPEERNFVIESMDYDEEYNCMLINGTLIDMPLDPVESFVELDENGALYIGATYDDGSGDVFNVLGCLRHLDDENWDYENDYPYLEQGALDFYRGKTFEEIVTLYNYDTSLIPALPEGTDTAVDAGTTDEPADSADGTVTLQQLKDWKNWLDAESCYETEYYKPTLDECVEAMGGVEPAPWKPEKWGDNMIVKWTTADGKDHIILTLKPEDDGETFRYHSISWSSGVNG